MLTFNKIRKSQQAKESMIRAVVAYRFHNNLSVSCIEVHWYYVMPHLRRKYLSDKGLAEEEHILGVSQIVLDFLGISRAFSLFMFVVWTIMC